MDALLAFFLGQLSLTILLLGFIQFFIFGESPSQAELRSWSRSHTHQSGVRPSSASLLQLQGLSQKRWSSGSSNSKTEANSGYNSAIISPKQVLSKTYYNVNGHQPESLDWFNVLVAQALAQLRAQALHDDALLGSLGSVLNGPLKPEYLGPIEVTELSLGEEFPIFSNCRIIPVDEAGVQVKSLHQATKLQARLDVDLSDAITLGIETKLVLNYPLPFVAVLPVALAVSVVRFSGTISLSFLSSPSSAPTPSSAAPSASAESASPETMAPSAPKEASAQPTAQSNPSSAPQTTLAFSFLPDYRLDLSVRSLLGCRARLQDIPKIAQIVEAQIHSWLDDRCVEPRYQQILLPSIWPQRKNTRGPGPDESPASASAHAKDDPPATAETANQLAHSPLGDSPSQHGQLEQDEQELDLHHEPLENRSLAIKVSARQPSQTELARRPKSHRVDSNLDQLPLPGQF